MKITVEGKKYEVSEDLGYQSGYATKAVIDDTSIGGERIAVKRGGQWTWWTVADRLGG